MKHSKVPTLTLLFVLAASRMLACSNEDSASDDRADGGTSSDGGMAGAPNAGGTDSTGTGTTGAGGSESDGGSGTIDAGGSGTDEGGGGQGGQSGDPSPLEVILSALADDLDAALLDYSKSSGWPLEIDGGFLFVSTDVAFASLELDGGASELAMQVEGGFAWVVAPAPAGTTYAFSDGGTSVSDPWSRSYAFDQDVEVSLVAPLESHLDRHFEVSDGVVLPRTIRVWVPQATATHVLYAQDGQNLFDPTTLYGGWKLQDTAPAAMMIVGIDNTPSRLDEYTHVQDSPGGEPVGGNADAYADFLEDTVRPLIAGEYGEPATRGLLGSSLGGLVSFYVAHELPASYDFAASLSGTMGWGSLAADVHNTTILELYSGEAPAGVVLYLDSGGSDTPPCSDNDLDGVADDTGNADNYCENAQLYSILKTAGYTDGVDVHYDHESGAASNEAAWAARVSQPLSIFAAL